MPQPAQIILQKARVCIDNINYIPVTARIVQAQIKAHEADQRLVNFAADV